MNKSNIIITSSLAFIALTASARLSFKFCQRKKIPSIQTYSEKKNILDLLGLYSSQFNNSGTVQQIIPRKFQNQKQLQNVTSNLMYRQTNSHLSSLSKSLSQPIYNLLDRGGKKWRPIICMLIAQLYGYQRKQVYQIAALCQIVHNGTLIIDDIQDSSTTRRDKPCVHLLYGIDISVNAGNFMYFSPLNYLLRSNKYNDKTKLQFAKIYSQQMTTLHIGQGWDILWHNTNKLNGQYPKQQHYLQMTAHKTGVLARLSSRLVCAQLNIQQNQAKSLQHFAQTMGVAFQIQDDLLNLTGVDYMATKGYFGQDIHQGKITLMVIYYLNSNQPQQKKDRLLQILSKKTQNQQQINQAILLLKQAGTFQKASKKMYQIIQNAWKKVQQNLPDNVYRAYLKQLAQYGIKRVK